MGKPALLVIDIPGTRGHALVDGLAPQPVEPIVRKKHWSAFHK